METCKALVALPNKSAIIQSVPVPQIGDEWILVKPKAVALNPTDWKKLDNGSLNAGCRLGVDYSGLVVDVGSKVTRFRKGDRVAGLVNGGDALNKENGAFAEYIRAKECVQMKMPENLTFQEAATIGLGVVTCGQGLYKTLRLPRPDSGNKDPVPVLIHGGSTATGILGIQFAKASGLFVIATSSSHNFKYLKSLGADAVFDYHSADAAMEIRKLTNNKLRHAWDCAGGGEILCAGALSDAEPSLYAGINLPTSDGLLQSINPLVEGPLLTAGYEVFGEEWIWAGKRVPAKREEMEFASEFMEMARKMFVDGFVLPVKPTVNKESSGLEGVLKGLDILRSGNVSATKLVYTL